MVPACDLLHHVRICSEVVQVTRKAICEAAGISPDWLRKQAWNGGYVTDFLATEVYAEIERRANMRLGLTP